VSAPFAAISKLQRKWNFNLSFHQVPSVSARDGGAKALPNPQAVIWGGEGVKKEMCIVSGAEMEGSAVQ